MNTLNEITSVAKNKSRKRVGRGSSAGGGTTAGRGTKGQKARTGGNVPARFEGGQTPFFQRIAKKKGFKHHRKFSTLRINIKDISRYAVDGKIVVADLMKAKKLQPSTRIKVLGEGDLKEAYQVQAHSVSAAAAKKIEAAGGKIEIV